MPRHFIELEAEAVDKILHRLHSRQWRGGIVRFAVKQIRILFADTVATVLTTEHSELQHRWQHQQGGTGVAIVFMIGILFDAANRRVIVRIR